jgi:hypothetical protein
MAKNIGEKMEINNIMAEDYFAKEYLLLYDKDYICYHCIYYERCRDIKYIYKEKIVRCIGYIKDKNYKQKKDRNWKLFKKTEYKN